MHKQYLIDTLGLTPHIEGGYFRRTYQSPISLQLPLPGTDRRLLSSIYYLLTDDSPIGYWHKNQSDIIHYFHAGSALTYWIIHPDGRLEIQRLGARVDLGEQLQLLVRGGCWKASELEAGEFGLISEAVAPGFDYQDMQLATALEMRDAFPRLWERIQRFIRAAA